MYLEGRCGRSSRSNVRASEIGSTIPNFAQWQAFVDTKMQVLGVFLRIKQAHTSQEATHSAHSIVTEHTI